MPRNIPCLPCLCRLRSNWTFVPQSQCSIFLLRLTSKGVYEAITTSTVDLQATGNFQSLKFSLPNQYFGSSLAALSETWTKNQHLIRNSSKIATPTCIKALNRNYLIYFCTYQKLTQKHETKIASKSTNIGYGLRATP